MHRIICPFNKKYELVSWAITTLGYNKSQANKLAKSQLYAIWYKSARKQSDRATNDYIATLSKDDQIELRQLTEDSQQVTEQLLLINSPVNMTEQLSLLMDSIWEGRAKL